MNSNFEIRRSGHAGTISGTLPATALKVGTPLMINSKDAATGINTFVVAAGRIDGWLTRETRVGPGLTSDEQLFGFVTYPSGEFATPFEAGKQGSIERAEAVELEGDDYIVGSGTGAITTNTAAGTILSATGGRVYVAQSTDWAEYRLAAQMTPVNGGTPRIYIEKIDGYKVA